MEETKPLEALEDYEKLKEENKELRVKCNKLLNDNFLLGAEITNLYKAINVFKKCFKVSVVKKKDLGYVRMTLDKNYIIKNDNEMKLINEVFGNGKN